MNKKALLEYIDFHFVGPAEPTVGDAGSLEERTRYETPADWPEDLKPLDDVWISRYIPGKVTMVRDVHMKGKAFKVYRISAGTGLRFDAENLVKLKKLGLREISINDYGSLDFVFGGK